MPQTLLQYLAQLANDPPAQENFKADPEAAIAAADLGEQDKAILRTRNNALISSTVGQQAVSAMIYAQPAMIYAQMIYAAPQMIYGMPPMIYGQPPMIYGHPPAPMIYAHPPMIYGHPPAPMIYGMPPQMIYAPPMIYAPMIYSPPAPKPGDSNK